MLIYLPIIYDENIHTIYEMDVINYFLKCMHVQSKSHPFHSISNYYITNLIRNNLE